MKFKKILLINIPQEAAVNRQELFTSNIENFLKGKPTNIVN